MLGLKKLPSVRQSGDTIVEVLIVLAVLGLAIGISYGTANRSLLEARSAQENSQATELLQSQLESLRSKQKTDPAIFSPGPFCIDPATHAVNPTPPCDYTSLYTTKYQVEITYDPASSTFKLLAHWDDIQGLGQDSVTFLYRLYP